MPTSRDRSMSASASRRSWRVRLPSALLVIALLAPLTLGAINEQELLCNEAVAHAQSCCPHLTLPFNTCDLSGGCNEPGHEPDLTIDQSNCLLSKDCSQLTPHCDDLVGAVDAGVLTCR